jgi:hypothetical protein
MESPRCKASEIPRSEAVAAIGLKHRMFASGQGETKHPTAGILAYGEDWMRGLNTETGQKDIFQTGLHRSDSQ